MALSTKRIKGAIKSIGNTKKMTKAMELVAASKMRKAINNVLASRVYSQLAWEIIKRLKTKTKSRLHKLLTPKKEVKNVLIVLLTSNRGLCGGHNVQIINKALKSCEKHEGKANTDFILVGKKGRQMANKFKKNVIAYFDKEDVIDQLNEIYPISRLVLDEYLADKYDKVLIAYTDFISTLKQVPRVRQLLPITKKDEYIGEMDSHKPISASMPDEMQREEEAAGAPERDSEVLDANYEYIFEPSADEVLESLLPRIIEVQLYQAYLEANASEHSARMMAMRNASDAAEDMIFDLSLSFNKARQAAITSEIAEISAGRAVLE